MRCPVKRNASFVVAAALVLQSGCSTYSVMRMDESTKRLSPVSGVPFYGMDAKCRQETVLQQDVRKLTLQIDSFYYNVNTGVPDSIRPVYRSEKLVGTVALAGLEFVKIRSLLDNSQQRDTLVRTFSGLMDYNPLTWHSDPALVLISNQTSAHPFVDYSVQYFINTERPLVGSSSASVELGPNGTLSKASAEVTENTLSTLLGMIPITELLTTALLPEAPGQQTGEKPVYRHSLAIERAPVLHSLSTFHPQDVIPCSPHPQIIPNATSTEYSYTRTVPQTAGTTPAGAAGNAISVSGQITLPQSKQP